MYLHEEHDIPEYAAATARYYKNLSELDTRKKAYRETERQLAREFGKWSRERAAALYYLAKFHEGDGNTNMALKQWLRLLEVEFQAYGVLSDDVAGTLNNIAIYLCKECNEDVLAEAVFRAAIAVEQALGGNGGSFAFNLADSLSERGEFARAVHWSRFAADVADDSSLRGKALHTLGMSYKRVGDLSKATEVLDRAVDLLAQSNNREQHANAAYNRATLPRQRNAAEEARRLEMLREAADIETALGRAQELDVVCREYISAAARAGDHLALDDAVTRWSKNLLGLYDERWPNDDHLYLPLDRQLVRGGNMELRRQVLEGYVQREPVAALRVCCAQQAMAEQDYRRAIEHIDALAGQDILGQDVPTLRFLALVYDRNWDKACELATASADAALEQYALVAKLEQDCSETNLLAFCAPLIARYTRRRRKSATDG